jgi:hypothetical protein
MDAFSTYHVKLGKAGALLDASGLQPSSKGWRIQYSGGKRNGHRRPLRRDKRADRRLHAHSSKVQGRSARLARRYPQSAGEGSDAEIEVGQLFELEDFGPSKEIERFREMGIGAEK